MKRVEKEVVVYGCGKKWGDGFDGCIGGMK